jgi:hypothetical protein
MHCIIVLATLFVTSCYWSAVPANTISPQVFDQLNITLTNSTDPLAAPLNGVREFKWDEPIQLLSRCWCDFTRTPFFDNLDVQAWEKASVLSHPMPAPEPSPPPSEHSDGMSSGNTDAGSIPVSELDNNAPPSLPRRLLGYVVPKRYLGQSPSLSLSTSTSTSASTPTSASTSGSASETITAKGGGFMRWWPLQRGGKTTEHDKPPPPPQAAGLSDASPAVATSTPAPPTETPPTCPPHKSLFRPLFIPSILLRPITHWRFRWPEKTTGKVQGPKLPWLRRRYDLSRHGIGIMLDFGWGRGENGEPVGPA